MPTQKNQEKESAFKNWFNEDLVQRMAEHIRHHHPRFDHKSFLKLTKQLSSLEMKPRMLLICESLHSHLPPDYPCALAILLEATLKPKPSLKALEGFDLWPITEFVARYGLEDFDISMQALHTLTQRFTSEFAVRPFLLKMPKPTLKQLLLWTKDPNPHVRRWTSEGTRPRLPWGILLPDMLENPQRGLKLLERLKYDEEIYVRKSVANHLNDFTKKHPDLIIQTLEDWQKASPKIHLKKIYWITRHALRTQVKAGNPKALRLLGYEPNTEIKLTKLKLNSKSVNIGDELEFNFHLSSSQDVRAVVDYAIHYRKANGSLAAKVFKLSNKEFKSQEQITFKKKHSFRPVTTRKLYSGKHRLEIIVNGKSLGKIDFILK